MHSIATLNLTARCSINRYSVCEMFDVTRVETSNPRYWELDSDHDGVISREDLLRYGGHRLSRAIVDRIFEVSLDSEFSCFV